MSARAALTALVLAFGATASAAPLTIHQVQSGSGCVDQGDRICSPDNVRGVPAGCYDDGGVLWAPWPCTAWQPSDGYRHGDGTWTAR